MVENSQEGDANVQLCLITHVPLDDVNICLPCQHTYNYKAICRELYNQKKRTRMMACPYCNASLDKYIPYVPHLYDPQYKSVIRKTNCINMKSCQYVLKRGPNKGNRCPCESAYATPMGDFCPRHDPSL